MKFVRELFIALLTLFLANCAFAEKFEVIKEYAALRESPSENAPIIQHAEKGWILDSSNVDSASDWFEIYQIDSGDGFWYVHKAYNLPGTNVFVHKNDVKFIREEKDGVLYPNIDGKVVKEFEYTDNTGKNAIALSETDFFVKPGLDHPNGGVDKEIFAYRFDINGTTPKKLWRVTDHIYDCDLDAKEASFIKKNVHVTDLDNDDVYEIWIPYLLNCAGDPGPVEMKIIMYEGMQKYAMRGKTREWVGKDDNGKDIITGGEYKMDSALQKSPAIFQEFAKYLWDKNLNRNK